MMQRRRAAGVALAVGVAAVVAVGRVAAQTGAQCALSDGSKYDCYPWDVSNATVCAAHGCCWSPSPNAGVPWCFYPQLPAPAQAACSAVSTPSRVDCHPELNADATSCAARGCCWQAPPASGAVAGVAYCFFPHTDGYTAGAATATASGFTAPLTLGAAAGPYRNDISPLTLDVDYVSSTTLRFQIYDATTPRWVPPVPLQPTPAAPPATTDYAVSITKAPAPFGITVTRASTGAVLFDSRVQAPPAVVTNGLIFEDQYLELSTVLPPPSGPDGGIHIYGLSEHVTPLQLPANGSIGQTYTLFARDQGTPVNSAAGATNLYASMPFYMVLDPATGDAFGVWLFNSNAMDVVLQGNALTYRVIGGELDVWLFTGPSPADVVAQYLAVIGNPAMPPRWGLGFHLCRWGYNSLNETQTIWQSMLDARLPQDVQWNDIDVWGERLDFVLDPAYPAGPMAAWVNSLHAVHGQHYVPIIDPAISSSQAPGSYPPFDTGVADRVFVNDSAGSVFIGSVWPGFTAFPDFFAPNTSAWWTGLFQDFHDNVLPIDGAWIDMNEPSNFCNGACGPTPAPPMMVAAAGDVAETGDTGRPAPAPAPAPTARPAVAAAAAAAAGLAPVRGPNNGAYPGDPKFPPYLPGRLGGATLLETKTVSMSARHYNGLHYNVHNLYGWGEGRATVEAMEAVRGKRAFVISRSTFAGSGAMHGHWLGDNAATWADLYYSLPGVLTMNLMGVPLVGADVCGFGGDATTPELCTRWMQLGAYTYGFYRNHNTLGKAEQAPSVFPDPYKSYMRTALNGRLALVPYLYTLFHHAHTNGTTVSRPLFFEFPTDVNVTALDTQVMLGAALMACPVITQGAVTTRTYFPAAIWYDWFTGARYAGAVPGWNTIPAPLSAIPVFIRGGYVVPTQDPNMTTVFSALNPFRLTAALDANGAAAGDMFLDDGDALRSFETGVYTYVAWAAATTTGGSAGTLTSTVPTAAYSPPGGLASVSILGVASYGAAGKATANGQPATATFNTTTGVLTLAFAPLPLTAPIAIQWQG